jgi:hypothetical protein
LEAGAYFNRRLTLVMQRQKISHTKLIASKQPAQGINVRVTVEAFFQLRKEQLSRRFSLFWSKMPAEVLMLCSPHHRPSKTMGLGGTSGLTLHNWGCRIPRCHARG